MQATSAASLEVCLRSALPKTGDLPSPTHKCAVPRVAQLDACTASWPSRTADRWSRVCGRVFISCNRAPCRNTRTPASARCANTRPQPRHRNRLPSTGCGRSYTCMPRPAGSPHSLVLPPDAAAFQFCEETSPVAQLIVIACLPISKVHQGLGSTLGIGWEWKDIAEEPADVQSHS